MDPVPLLDSDETTPAEKPLIYIILGATGSGRREVLADVIHTLKRDSTCTLHG